MCYSVMIYRDLKKIEKRFHAQALPASWQRYYQEATEKGSKIKLIEDHPRIYPGYYAPIIRIEGEARIIEPMRYRLRPFWAEKEIPSQYNTFNARLDALEERRSWKSLFMKRHGLIVFEKFYEWVELDGEKTVLSFEPKDQQMMWAPVLWDRWTDGKKTIESFAIITTDPPPEVAMMGHDRCPIFLAESQIDIWLHPERHTKKRIYQALHTIEPVYYGWQRVA